MFYPGQAHVVSWVARLSRGDEGTIGKYNRTP